MAEIRRKPEMFEQLSQLAKTIEEPARMVGDEETLALAKVMQYSLTAVKDPAKRERLLKALDILQMPSTEDLLKQFEGIL